jgi:hypothetical protein
MYTAVLDTGEMVSRPVEKNKAVAWGLAKWGVVLRTNGVLTGLPLNHKKVN